MSGPTASRSRCKNRPAILPCSRARPYWLARIDSDDKLIDELDKLVSACQQNQGTGTQKRSLLGRLKAVSRRTHSNRPKHSPGAIAIQEENRLDKFRGLKEQSVGRLAGCSKVPGKQ